MRHRSSEEQAFYVSIISLILSIVGALVGTAAVVFCVLNGLDVSFWIKFLIGSGILFLVSGLFFGLSVLFLLTKRPGSKR